MSNIDKQALREVAELFNSEEGDHWWDEEQLTHEDGLGLNEADGKFIATANPATVLALLDELEAAEKRIAELEALTASMEQEPVAYTCIDALDDVYCGSTAMMGPAGAVGEVPLYAAPQLPQPAVLSVPDGVLKSLLPDAEKPDFWFEHNGKIFLKV